MPDSSRRLTTRINWQLAIFILILAVGVFLRAYRFIDLPHGLHQDELSATYEAWSLLQYGTDKYGNPWPVYFPAWGSGMNVLYSYLSIPFVAVFGLTTLAVRSVALILGIAALPLMYVTAKRFYGAKTALFAMFLLAILPWHVMISRWGLEANILPFFLLLGMYTLHRGLDAQARPWQRVIALLPWALALYCYGLGLFAVFGTVVLVAVFYWRRMREHPKQWVAAYGIFTVIALPFILFLLQNYVFKRAFAFLQGLPITIPYLPKQRLAEVEATDHPDPTLLHNVKLILSGFNDSRFDNSLSIHSPVPVVLLLLIAAALIAVVVRYVRSHRLHAPSLPQLVLVSSLPLLFIFPMFTQQANSFLMLVPLFAAEGALVILSLLPPRRAVNKLLRVVAAALLFAGLGYSVGQSYSEYTGNLYAQPSSVFFKPEVKDLVQNVDKAAHGAPVFVTDKLNGGYMYILWYLHVDPKEFQAGHTDPDHHNFANYHFYTFDLPTGTPYYYLLSVSEKPQCAGTNKVLGFTGAFKIGYCSAAG